MTNQLSTGSGKRLGPVLHHVLCLYFAPALLISVASAKLFDSSDKLKSPWKGGAFGMFSSIDYPPARMYRVSLVKGDRVTPVVLDGRFAESMRVWKNMPADENLKTAAELFASYTWAHPASIHETSLTPDNPDRLIQLRPMGIDSPVIKGFVPFDFDRARVEIWRYGFDSKSETSEMVLINAAESSRP